jgi:geranylgeranyl reductase family protein
MHTMFDVIVIGAGPAGSSAAYYLSRAGLNTLLVDKAEFPRDKTCGDGLTPRALPVLDDMGILAEATRHGWRLDVLKVSAPSGGSVTLQLQPMPRAPGYALVVPRLKLDNLIREAAVSAGAHFVSGVHVKSAQVSPVGITIKAHRETFSGRMAVIATGANMGLLRTLGLLNTHRSMSVAARAYFEDMPRLDNCFHFRFDGVVLPGYGWIFPLSPTSANVGAGYFRANHQHKTLSAQAGFQRFVQSPGVEPLLANARQQGPLKSFPIRTDFADSPTYADRLLLAGEAAGLVNPLTGDGIDYALESGKIAAEHLIGMFNVGDFSRPRLEAYDQHLRQKYQKLLRFCEQVTRLAVRHHRLNVLVALAGRHPKLPVGLMNYVLGAKELPDQMTPLYILKRLVANL